MKKSLLLLILIICMVGCESTTEYDDEPSCWRCEFSTADDSWWEYYCDLTPSEIRDYEDQVYSETDGEIYVWCNYFK